MKANRFSRAPAAGDDQGVTVVVGAILLVAILIGALVTVRLSFVPVWEEDAEAAHMQEVTKQMSSLKSEMDRQVENRTRTPVSTTVPLSRTSASIFGGTSLTHAISLTSQQKNLHLQTQRLLLTGENGTSTAEADEEWNTITGAQSVDDVGDVFNFRLRVTDDDADDQLKPSDPPLQFNVTLRDAKGAFAGRLEIYVDKEVPDMYLNVRTIAADGVTELYDNVHLSTHSQRWQPPYWVDALDSAFRFDRLIEKAEKPATLAIDQWTDRELDADFTVSYLTSTEGDVVGGSGLLETNFQRNFTGGTLSYLGTNQHFVSQTYVLEHGALILDQDDGAIFRVPPHMTASVENDHLNLGLGFTTLRVGETVITGDLATVLTQGAGQTTFLGLAPNITITLDTNYPGLWAQRWTEVLTDAGLVTEGTGCTPSDDCQFAVTTTSKTASLVVYGPTAHDPDPDDPTFDLTLQFHQGYVDMEVRG